MAECVLQKELGKILIDENVISTMVGLATIECAGVVGMASKRATDGLVEMLGRENLRRGVVVVVNGDSISASVFIVVEYGVSIGAVAKTVMESVKYRIEDMTGVKVTNVNVSIEGIRI
jgi:uncharacterized alkaline shock family protein YloU